MTTYGLPWPSSQPNAAGDAMEQRFAFDQIAGAYRAHRPDYPEALVNDVVSYASLKPGDPVLEVGCGTGQATKSFATRDLQIVAIDPGPEMVRAARESLAHFDNVELVETTFEAWSQDKAPFRLIIAAQSWHWVSPELRFVKAATLLSSDGLLAVFGHVPTGLPIQLLEQFRKYTCVVRAAGGHRRKPTQRSIQRLV